ncbi:hypothetical protein KIN20_004568 [Parelaphostrongylus tenuis]|uniref:Uncharacterized protein n=1 Tax=Parelaphostrongylus tenuis TaxID=148309 RepID=A0AAD5MHH0_PARTN|nr:hypothetical protein KIN20_004568 [Parelaphostrongylus tenuis]
MLLVGLIVERRDDVFLIYCNSRDYRLSSFECPSDYEVGVWIGLNLCGDKVERHGVLLGLDDLPRVRVIGGRAEVLTSGRVVGMFCDTKDFYHIPILFHLPENIVLSQNKIQIWVRRLTNEERNLFQGMKWGACEFVENDRPSQQNSQHFGAVNDRHEVNDELSINVNATRYIQEQNPSTSKAIKKRRTGMTPFPNGLLQPREIALARLPQKLQGESPRSLSHDSHGRDKFFKQQPQFARENGISCPEIVKKKN